MKMLCIIAFLFVFGKGYAQDVGPYQSAAVYKQNTVKTRTVSNGRWFPIKTVDHFNTEGLLMQRDYFTTAKKFHFGSQVFRYDTGNNLIWETYFSYGNNQLQSDTITNAIETIIYHDSLHRITRKIYTNTGNIIISVIEYLYNPCIIKRKSHNPTGYFEETSWLDDQQVEEKITTTFYDRDSVITEMSEATFKNYYDRFKKLKKREIRNTVVPHPSYMDLYRVKMEYYYFGNGLLSSCFTINGRGDIDEETYTYTFW